MGEPKRLQEPAAAPMDQLIDCWSAMTALWRKELGSPRDEAIWWQPFRKSHSIGGILLHLADVEGKWIEECLNGQPRSEDELELLRSTANRPMHRSWADPPEWSFTQYLEVLAWIRNRSIATLRKFSDPSIEFESPDGKKTIAEAVHYLAFHEAYHVGQAVLHQLHFDWGGVEPS